MPTTTVPKVEYDAVDSGDAALQALLALTAENTVTMRSVKSCSTPS